MSIEMFDKMQVRHFDGVGNAESKRGFLIDLKETLETSLICILLLASRDVHFDKRMICFLSDLL